MRSPARCGYAFADIVADLQRDAEKQEMNITFRVGETPRVYVERIDIQGNTVTRDKVVRREFRLNEGDAFNAFKVKRSQDRIQSLGFFQENLEIKQTQGSSPDRVVLNARRRGKIDRRASTCRPAIRALRSSSFPASVAQRNFMGKGQQLQRRHQLFALFEVGLSWASSSPICSTRTSCLAAISSAATTTASIIDDNGERDTTYAPAQRGRRHSAWLPGHRICHLRHALLAGPGRYHARQGYLFH